jgi:transposase
VLTVDVPGQRGANITMCAALSNDGLLCHIPLIGSYNTERLIYFLDDLHNRLVPVEERGARNSPTFVVVWDNVIFHHSAAVTDLFDAHPRMSVLFLSPYSPFLNPIEEFFSAWRRKVYDHHPHDQMSLLDAMNAGVWRHFS